MVDSTAAQFYDDFGWQGAPLMTMQDAYDQIDDEEQLLRAKAGVLLCCLLLLAVNSISGQCRVVWLGAEWCGWV